MAEYAVKMIKLDPIHLNFLFGSRHIFSFFFLGYVYPKFFTDTPGALTKPSRMPYPGESTSR
jgi:hypothetical protein